MAQTYLVYILLLFICWLSARGAERSNKKNKLLWAIFALTIVAGFRAPTVGIDTKNYIQKLGLIAQGSLEYNNGLEIGFKYLCAILLKIWNDSTFVFVILAFITNYFIIMRFWDFKKVSLLSCMVLCYYTGFFFMTMNVMRHFCAVAIIFYALRLISKRKYLRFLIVIFTVSIFFHQSVYISIVYLALEVFMWKELTKGQRKFLITCAIALPFVFTYIVEKVAKYEHYFSESSASIGLMLPIKIAFVLLTILLIKKKRINQQTGLQSSNQSENYIISTSTIYYLIGLAISSLGYMYQFMDRIGWYFYIFEGVYFGILLKNSNGKDKMIWYLGIMFLMGYSFISAINTGSQSATPYLFIWQ